MNRESRDDWEERADASGDGQRSFADESWGDASWRRRVRCWRCDKVAVPNTGGRCPYCRAKLETGLEDRIAIPESKGINPILKVLAILAAMMVVSVVYFKIVMHLAERQLISEAEWQQKQMFWSFVVAGIHTLVVVVGFVWIGLLPPLSKPQWQWRVAAWIWGMPVLGALLFLNLGYVWLVNRYIHGSNLTIEPPLTVLSWVAMCLLPAVLEEFVFRYLAINSLRPHMGMHGTVWTSSAMFGLSHLGNPLAIPSLTVVGAGLGYMRILSGGLLLPMLMHMLHNMAVLYLGSIL